MNLAKQRRQRAADADALLQDVFAAAIATANEDVWQGLALVAVGGYGRAELSPASDLDVVLLHDPAITDERIQAIAEAVWYPLWEKNIALDHSVRDTVQMRQAAHEDYRAALGMLDARHVAGDSALVLALRAEVLADWRRDARSRLVELRDACETRVERFGWLAHAAVPDLKESGGGLRDGVVMRALVATWLVDVPHAESEELRSALLDVRDALHITSGRRLEKLDPERLVDVAAFLGRDPELLEFETRNLGRRTAHLATQAWRRVDDALRAPRAGSGTPSRPVVERIADGVGRLGDEVVVMSGADPQSDPEVALRAAAAAARAGLEFESSSAANLARNLGRLAEPWPESARRAMVDLLTAGPGLVSVWDELDHAGVVDLWLPEWDAIRLRGSSSPIHRFTVDRHTIETCVNATKLVRTVARPDLLAVGALLHDIGKGRPGDHSIVGEPMAEAVALRWGFDAEDAATIGKLVRHHLTIPNVATRRDIEDPSTAENVAASVETEELLDLLAALTASDAQATGPTAWTTWRRGLIEGLVEKTRSVLQGTAGESTYEGWPSSVPMPDTTDLTADDVRLTVENHRGGSLLTFALRDRPGVMAAIAGCFALLGMEIRSARTLTIDHAAMSLWEVTRPDVDAARVRDRLIPILKGEVDLAARLALKPTPDEAEPRVRILPRRSQTATLIEVRAHDRRGLVWTVCHEIANAGHSIRSAHLSTYGSEARDVFYVVDADNGQPLDDDAALRMREAIAEALV
ncbi:MAG: [protein-PII] uridylyltransferase [Aeromicrobium sp.]